MSISRGWHKPSDRHKYHYFEEGESLCLKYHWYPVRDEEYDNVYPIWDEEASMSDDATLSELLDPRFCVMCQFYEGFGKCGPHDGYTKCDYCGRFGARGDHEVWNHYTESVDMVVLCRECGTWSNRNDNSE